MKDYSAMSDFEINKAVADIAMNGTWHLEPSHPNNTTGGWLYGSNGIQTYPMPDYCNNPADAWPIIFRERITLTPKVMGYEWDAISPVILNDDIEHLHTDKNPIRAVMIVFLMMKERGSSHA
ncbi:phage protein NinX family protein [Yersinia pseudotuberculosis]|uniref:phage protein NinX family protein n=1 Tax=Yersinia pseudotuberculosis TaxID=633 RepID=UPI00094ADF78|nr:phage protein NinX family protein [Yersinia pseudotuberculosis]